VPINRRLDKENVEYVQNIVLLNHKEIMSFAEKWMELEITLLSEKKRPRKITVFLLMFTFSGKKYESKWRIIWDVEGDKGKYGKIRE
jgi:hypothetical protein